MPQETDSHTREVINNPNNIISSSTALLEWFDQQPRTMNTRVTSLDDPLNTATANAGPWQEKYGWLYKLTPDSKRNVLYAAIPVVVSKNGKDSHVQILIFQVDQEGKFSGETGKVLLPTDLDHGLILLSVGEEPGMELPVGQKFRQQGTNTDYRVFRPAQASAFNMNNMNMDAAHLLQAQIDTVGPIGHQDPNRIHDNTVGGLIKMDLTKLTNLPAGTALVTIDAAYNLLKMNPRKFNPFVTDLIKNAYIEYHLGNLEPKDSAQLLEIILERFIPPHQRDFYREIAGNSTSKLARRLLEFAKSSSERINALNALGQAYEQFRTSTLDPLAETSTTAIEHATNHVRRTHRAHTKTQRDVLGLRELTKPKSIPGFDPDKLTQREIDRAMSETSQEIEAGKLLTEFKGNEVNINREGSISSRLRTAIESLNFKGFRFSPNFTTRGSDLVDYAESTEHAEAIIAAYDAKILLVQQGQNEEFLSKKEAEKLIRRYKKEILKNIKEEIKYYKKFAKLLLGNRDAIIGNMFEERYRRRLQKDTDTQRGDRVNAKLSEILDPLINRRDSLQAELYPPKTKKKKISN